MRETPDDPDEFVPYDPDDEDNQPYAALTDPDPAPDPLTPRQWTTIQRYHGFTDKQMNVVRGVVRGLTDAQIAEELHLPQGTLRSRFDAIFQRCGTRKRVGVVMKVLEPLIKCWQ